MTTNTLRSLRPLWLKTTGAAVLAVAGVCAAFAAEPALPNAKPVPDVQVLPQPYAQASFEYLGRELTRYHFGPELRRPFWYPITGPGGRSLTRMNMPYDPGKSMTRDKQPADPTKPEDPLGHSHQTSVWICHKDVNGFDFWRDGGPIAGQILHETARDCLEYDEVDGTATLLTRNAWNDPKGNTLMVDRRLATVSTGVNGSWWLVIDLQFEAPPGKPVTLGKTTFGPLGIRMAKTVSVHEGGGRILNSGGDLNEKGVFRKHARWVDYSGPVTRDESGGITLMDHPQNPNHPAIFHVRDNGWLGVTLTPDATRVIEPGKPLRLRYALWVHNGVPGVQTVDQQWQSFAQRKLAVLKVKHPQ
ncbi:MAG: hypothetical protein GX565_04265 [Lentisphaerae bacterium]|nr:hypothetical protein [Lentisphaerota bacterium]